VAHNLVRCRQLALINVTLAIYSVVALGTVALVFIIAVSAETAIQAWEVPAVVTTLNIFACCRALSIGDTVSETHLICGHGFIIVGLVVVNTHAVPRAHIAEMDAVTICVCQAITHALTICEDWKIISFEDIVVLDIKCPLDVLI
jgi:hypothetical protein